MYRILFPAADPPTIGETVGVRSEGTLNGQHGTVTSVEPNGVVNVRIAGIERPILPGEIVRDPHGPGRR